jgi:hypothetical protein
MHRLPYCRAGQFCSATFSFDHNVPPFYNALPASDFTANFPLTIGAYLYHRGFDSLVVIFFSSAGFNLQTQFIDFSTHFTGPSVSRFRATISANPANCRTSIALLASQGADAVGITSRSWLKEKIGFVL